MAATFRGSRLALIALLILLASLLALPAVTPAASADPPTGRIAGTITGAGGVVIPADDPRHVVAVSANNLLGVYLDDPDTYAWLRDRTPTAVLGGSIYLFDLTGDPDAVRRLSRLP